MAPHTPVRSRLTRPCTRFSRVTPHTPVTDTLHRVTRPSRDREVCIHFVVKTKTASLIFEEEKDQLQVVDKLQIVDKGVAPTVQNVGDLFVEGRIITLSCAQQRARVCGDASRPVAGSPSVVSDGEPWGG